MKSDLYLSFVVVFQLVVTVLQLLLPIYGITSVERAANLRVLVTAATYMLAVYYVYKRKSKTLVLSFFFYAFFLLFSYSFFPESRTFIESDRSYTLTPISILTVLIMISLRDFDCFQRVLLCISRVCPFIAIAYIYGRGIGVGSLSDQDSAYSMSMGYSFLLPCLFLFSQSKITDKLLSIILLVVILLDGSRGPVIVIALYYLYQFLFFSRMNTKKGWAVLVVALVGLYAILYLVQSGFFEESRTISLAESGELISHDSGRDYISLLAQMRIAENPILGYGVGSDRSLLGGYAHNIFLEVFLHYGLFIGSLLFVVFFFGCIRLYTNKKLLETQGGRSIFIMMFLFGFIPMLVSGSYLIDISFAVMIGYLLRFSEVRKLIKKDAIY